MTAQHWLVVRPWDPKDPDLMEVEHGDCPRELLYGEADRSEWQYTCAVGFYVGEYGISEYFQHVGDEDSFSSAYVDRLVPGRYEIEAWHRKHPAGPWGPEEHDAGLRLVK